MDYLSIYLVFLFHLSNFCSSLHIDILHILLDLYLSNLLDANLSGIVFFFKFFKFILLQYCLFYALVFWPKGLWDLSSPTMN